MNLELIGYVLYSGLGLLIIAFLLLLASMVSKQEVPAYDYNNQNDFDDEYDDEVVEEYEEPAKIKKERKSLFAGLTRKNKKNNKHTQEEYEDEYEYDFDDSYVEDEEDNNGYSSTNLKKPGNESKPKSFDYEDDGVEDEYESDFDFLETVTKKNYKSLGDFNFDKYGRNTEDEDDTDFLYDDEDEIKPPSKQEKSGMTIKKYEEPEEDIEAEMLERIKAYKDRYNKK